VHRRTRDSRVREMIPIRRQCSGHFDPSHPYGCKTHLDNLVRAGKDGSGKEPGRLRKSGNRRVQPDLAFTFRGAYVGHASIVTDYENRIECALALADTLSRLLRAGNGAWVRIVCSSRGRGLPAAPF
jgi:hypothetical protein